MQRYKAKEGLKPGVALKPNPLVTAAWLAGYHCDQPLVFEGVVPGKFGTEGCPLVKIGYGRTAYANFLAVAEDGSSIVEPVAVEQQVGVVTA